MSQQNARAPIPGEPPRSLDRLHAVIPDPWHVSDYLQLLYKRRGTVLATVGLVLFVVAVYNFSATPVYQATAQLLVDRPSPRVVLFDESGADRPTDVEDYMETQFQLLRSRRLAARTIQAIGLGDHPEFNGGQRSLRGRMTDAVVGALLAVVPSRFRDSDSGEPPAPEETADTVRLINRFLARLDVAPVRGSQLVNVRFRSSDPELAAVATNTLTDMYIRQNQEFKVRAARDAAEWLDRQLAEQRVQVESSEGALQDFREREGTAAVSADLDSRLEQSFNDLGAALTRARLRRIEKEAESRQAEVFSDDPDVLETLPSVQASPVLMGLRTELANLHREIALRSDTLGDNHPQMVQLRADVATVESRLQAEMDRVIEAVHGEYRGALEEERRLRAALDAQSREEVGWMRTQLEQEELERDVETDRRIFESLLQRAKEATVSSDLQATNIQVVDPAVVPLGPISPRKSRNLAFGLFVGLGLSVVCAFFFEYFHNQINTPDDIRTALGIPCLGLIPRAEEANGLEPLLSKDVPTTFAEAFRGARTNVIFAAAHEPKRSIVITSTSPGEGKTMVACNLALGIAMTGQRVLLVDADLRKPRVHEVFGISQGPGLAELLTSLAELLPKVKTADEVTRASEEYAGLSIVTAGEIPTNPAELMSSPALSSFVQSSEESYDWVIIDSPPVLPVTDSSLIANVASGVLFVVGADRTEVPLARAALQQLDTGRARYVGALLNDVKLDRNSYFYSNYYRREYGSYYQKSA